jgi:NitT/TauT family transport system substrate-binding protein
MSLITKFKGIALTGTAALFLTFPALADVAEIRISRGYGLLYLPLIVMEDQKLLEKQAAKAGLGDIKVQWLLFDGGNVINDAMMSGNLDIAGTGAPGFVVLWSKARGIASTEVTGISGLSATSLWLNTNNPAIKSLSDFSPKDKIALPGIKTSLSAVVLQMMVAKTFGPENFSKLDPLTVSLPHPDALTSLLSGKTEITAHLTSPPFSYVEVQDPKIHKVVNSGDVLGNVTLDVVYAPKKFVNANPKLIDAFLAAQEEANALIASNPKEAAHIYIRSSKMKVSEDEVLKILADPDTRYSTTPTKVMNFAEFLSLSGTIKKKPADWKELFIPQLHAKPGS